MKNHNVNSYRNAEFTRKVFRQLGMESYLKDKMRYTSPSRPDPRIIVI